MFLLYVHSLGCGDQIAVAWKKKLVFSQFCWQTSNSQPKAERCKLRMQSGIYNDDDDDELSLCAFIDTNIVLKIIQSLMKMSLQSNFCCKICNANM